MTFKCTSVVTEVNGTNKPKILIRLSEENIKVLMIIQEPFEKIPEDIKNIKVGDEYNIKLTQ